MGGIELFWDADIVPDNTPESWELLEPWKTIAYVEFAFTRRWGLAEYLENEVKTQIGGAIDVAYDIMGDTYREYGDFYISGVKGGYMYRAIDAMIVLHELMLDIEHNQHEHDYESLCAPVITTRGEDEGPSYPAGDSCGQDSIDAGDEGAESAAESCGDAGDDGGGC
jgi:hypothetical protein